MAIIDVDSLPYTEFRTLIDVLDYWAASQPDELAYIFLQNGDTNEVRITFRQLQQQAQTVAVMLQDADAAGQRALLLYPQGIDYMVGFFGCLYAGVIAVPVYPPTPAQLSSSVSRIQAIVQDAQPTVILTTQSVQTMAHDVGTFPLLDSLTWISTDTLSSDGASRYRPQSTDSSTLAYLQYTSGSTSSPKGVMVTHGNLLANHRAMQTAFQHPEGAPYVSWLPLFHDMGLIGHALQTVYLGVPCVLMSPLAFVQRPFRWLRAISHYRAHTSGAPNFAFELCVRKVTPEQIATLDLSCWQQAWNGAEPVRPMTLERFAATFAACGFRRESLYPCYGLAEATLVVSGGEKQAPPRIDTISGAALERKEIVPVAPEMPGARVVVACGQALRDQQVVIVDPATGLACAPDQVGEIWVGGPHVAQGYWQRPEETQQTFGAHLADTQAGPFMRTGDLGFFLDDELVIAGRYKDMIIIDGRNYYPHDLELTVEQSHPAFKSSGCAAFSIDVDDMERLVIIAEVDHRYRPERADQAGKNGSAPPRLSIDELARSIRYAIAEEYDVPVYDIVLLRSGGVLKTSSGKVQRKACRAAYLSQTLKTWEE